jgi:mannose-6-phosphate isomerase-like protein (cupin superfamily)
MENMFLILEPGEVFEHTHQDSSITMLVEGAVDLVVGSERSPLARGEERTIPAGVAHWLVNVGVQLAMLKCVHGAELPAG